MKILISVIFISLSLFARVNPFEPTDTFEEKKNKILETKYNQTEKYNVEEVEIESELVIPDEVIIKKELQVKDGCDDSYVYDILPFVKVSTDIESISFKIKSKYKLMNQDLYTKNRKLVFDFKGKTKFYTKRKALCHKYFKSFAIGCHREKNYFRIVIELNDKLANYKDIVNIQENVVTIKFIGD
ncbi:MAG: AMIN domain-containing protein [Campylobacterota bacterium]|nr:AMIN domain-containing protein [Campylobacterota bacterium]